MLLSLLLLSACTPSDPVASDCDCPTSDTAPVTGDSGTDDSDTSDTDTDTDTDDSGGDDSGTLPPVPTQVYLLGGQSNMDGYTYATGLPPSLQVSQDDVTIYWSGRPLWTGLAPSSAASAYYDTDCFGPEVTFGRSLADARPDADVALIKHAVGGTDLAVCWYPGADDTDPAMGTCYADWLSTVRSGLAELEGDYEIAGMIWMQGESDASYEPWSADYADNLRSFIDRVREDVETDDLPFAMGVIDCIGCPYRETVQEAQRTVADESALVFSVETEDLPQNGDNIHFDGSGMRTLGERLADVLLGGTGTAATAQPAFTLTGSGQSLYTGDFVVGYAFQTADPIILTDLGTLDYGLDGLSDGATVAVWDAGTQSVVARITVPGNQTAPTAIWGSWRYAGIEPVSLPPGDYVIGAQVYSGSADRYIHNVPVTVAGGITWIEGRHSNGTAVLYPTLTTAAETSWFGPNFLFIPGE
ncbi:MAG: hypothetical protein ACI8RZ_000665 [Myxococcota bacterium]|jgi:hypothetical protein